VETSRLWHEKRWKPAEKAMQSAKQINDMFHTKPTVHGKPEYVHDDDDHNDDDNEGKEVNKEEVSSLEDDDDDDDDDVGDDVDDVDDNVVDVVVVVARIESIFSILGRITQLNLSICTMNTKTAITCVQMFSVSLFHAKADMMHFR